MTDAEKLVAIESIFRDLVALRRHLAKSGYFDGVVGAETAALRHIAEIVGFDLPRLGLG